MFRTFCFVPKRFAHNITVNKTWNKVLSLLALKKGLSCPYCKYQISLGSQPSIIVGSFFFFCLSTVALDTSALSRNYLANDVLYCFLKLPSHPFDPWNVCMFSCSTNKTACPCSISPVKRSYLESASLNHS